MSENITIKLNGKSLEILPGSTIAELLARSPHPGPCPALGAIVGSRVAGLYRKIRGQGEIRTIDRTSKEGMEIYRRTASILLYAACKRLFPDDLVKIGQSLMGGYFFTVNGHNMTKKRVKAIEQNMRQLVEKDHPLRPKWIDVETAIRLARHNRLDAKAALLLNEFNEETAVVELDNQKWHLMGQVAMSTGAISCFALTPYQGGLVLHFPAYSGNKPEVKPPQPTLFSAFRETQEWNALVGCENVAQLNEHCVKGSVSRLIKISEALHEKKIASIADRIISRMPDARLILIAGPSSSGKTTFSKRLEVQLQVSGVLPVTLSMDNYYLNRNQTPKHEDGSYDFEHIEALDLKLLNDHVKRIIAGQEVKTPIFSFQTGKRDPHKTIPIKLDKRGVLIIEGIHSLNDRLTSAVPQKNKFKIFVSALTQLAIDEHNRIFTSDNRLVRRIVRDRLYRSYSAEQTILGWPSVRKGETEHIFRFQELADVMFNSALVYEPAVLKPYAERFLMEVPRTSPAYLEAFRLYQFLQWFIPVMSQEVPLTSVLREFIGGSTFTY